MEERMRPSRARVATWLLTCVLPAHDADAIVGDLEEERAMYLRGTSAAVWYWCQVVKSLPSLGALIIRRAGIWSTIGVALAVCAVQAAVEVGTGLAVQELFPRGDRWPVVLTLLVTLPSLAAISYRAARIRPGAPAVFALIATTVIAAPLMLVPGAGARLPQALASLALVPTIALTGGGFALRR
jgi:hypothetical protein